MSLGLSLISLSSVIFAPPHSLEAQFVTSHVNFYRGIVYMKYSCTEAIKEEAIRNIHVQKKQSRNMLYKIFMNRSNKVICYTKYSCTIQYRSNQGICYTKYSWQKQSRNRQNKYSRTEAIKEYAIHNIHEQKSRNPGRYKIFKIFMTEAIVQTFCFYIHFFFL